MQTQDNAFVQTPAKITDGVLLQRIMAGDQEAYESLVCRYSTQLFSYIYHMLRDYDQTCDILQEVMLKLYLSLAKLRTDEPLKPWLYMVARNRCLDLIRQQTRRRTIHFSEFEAAGDEDEAPLLLNIPDSSALPEDVAEHHVNQQRIWRAIQALPPKFRDVVSLRYAAQMSFSEISNVLGMPTATAKTYFQRAKPLLRTYLQLSS
jgi:RNA polymerase sigma factor (sigma-70 family)